MGFYRLDYQSKVMGVLVWDLFDELWVNVGGKFIWSKVTVPNLGIQLMSYG